MRLILLSTLLISILPLSYGQQSVLPFDFEAAPLTADFVNFDGATATVLANPQIDADNGSATVAQIVRDGGAVWAGSKLLLTQAIDFSTATGFSMQVFTPAAGIMVKLKLEGNGSTERDVLTTVANQWETLTWDFSGEPTNTFTEVVFMFDFGNVGDGSANSTFLFDNVMQIDFSGGLDQIDLPVDFDNTEVFFSLTDFEGASSVIGQDPDDGTNQVGISTKSVTAGSSAGTTIGTPAGFANPIPITAMETKMTVRVFSPDAGIPVRLKIEDHTDPTRSVETEALTTMANQWETLEFDFSNEAPGTAALDLSFTFDKASIFFNFGTDGATAGEKTYYWDDVRFGDLTGFVEAAALGLTFYPNPVISRLNLSAEVVIDEVVVFSQLGQQLLSFKTNSEQLSLDWSSLPAGMYWVRLKAGEQITVLTALKAGGQ